MTRPPTMSTIAQHAILGAVLLGIIVLQLETVAAVGVTDFPAVAEISLFAGILYMVIPFVEWGWRLAADRVASAGDQDATEVIDEEHDAATEEA